MSFAEYIALIERVPQLLALLPRIERAAETEKRVMADPNVKDAIALVGEIETILKGVVS
jgi:hypothetical protein